MSLDKFKNINPKDNYFYDLLKQIIKKVSNSEPAAKIFVFGSFVDGRFTPESDIDLAVILPDHWSPRKFIDLLYEQGHLSPWPLDLLVFNSKDFLNKKDIGGVCTDIFESGVEIYPKWSLINEPSQKEI